MKDTTEQTLSAEERIKEAAKKVFLEKGYDGTTTRDIAKEAGVNSALMNYYFRSKEKLFYSIFQDLSHLFFQGMHDILNKPLTLREKITQMIDHDFQMFKKYPDLSLFIFHEIHRNPDVILEILPAGKQFIDHIFEVQLNEAAARGEIRNLHVRHVLLMLISSVQFIYQARIMHKHLWSVTDNEYDAFAENHKKVVTEMILSYLFI